MQANVQIAVAEDLGACRVARGIISQENLSARASACATVSDQRGATRGRGFGELQEALPAPLPAPPLMVKVLLSAVAVPKK